MFPLVIKLFDVVIISMLDMVPSVEGAPILPGPDGERVDVPRAVALVGISITPSGRLLAPESDATVGWSMLPLPDTVPEEGSSLAPIPEVVPNVGC